MLGFWMAELQPSIVPAAAAAAVSFCWRICLLFPRVIFSNMLKTHETKWIGKK